jgi:hypothetical protein
MGRQVDRVTLTMQVSRVALLGTYTCGWVHKHLSTFKWPSNPYIYIAHQAKLAFAQKVLILRTHWTCVLQRSNGS